MRLIFVFLTLLNPSFSFASDCPNPPDHSDTLNALITEVRGATNDREAKLISNQMWKLWADAPDEPSQALLDSGMQK
ncbi:MAG: hypothetical protein JJ897_03950, partial [Marinibacterium sp.]|nr:hypothetical protein [Marinibacterium sp.]